jgi:hypothetical protein
MAAAAAFVVWAMDVAIAKSISEPSSVTLLTESFPLEIDLLLLVGSVVPVDKKLIDLSSSQYDFGNKAAPLPRTEKIVKQMSTQTICKQANLNGGPAKNLDPVISTIKLLLRYIEISSNFTRNWQASTTTMTRFP